GRYRRCRRPGAARPPAQQEAVDDPRHGLVGVQALQADALHGLCGDRPARLAHDPGQVDLVDDVLRHAYQVHAVEDQPGEVELVQGVVDVRAEVDPLDDEGGEVEPVERLVDDAGEVHVVDDDRVQV